LRGREGADREIGCRAQGFSDIMAQKDEEIVALCDIVEDGRSSPSRRTHQAQGAQGSQREETHRASFRRETLHRFSEMLLEMDDEIDAVGIATPATCISCPPTVA